MRRILLCMVLLIHSTTFAMPVDQSEYETKLLPGGRLFRSSFADPREIRMALLFEGNSKLNAYIGNYFSILAVESEDRDAWRFHFGIEGAGYFGLRQQDSRFPLETTDGLVGVYSDAALRDWRFQFRYTHISAHLADGSNEVAIAYSREFVVLKAAYVFSPLSQIYVGGHLVTNSVQDTHPYGVQIGGDYFFPWYVAKFAPYIATDLKWDGGAVNSPSFALQLGLAINNPPEAYRSFRFFYAYYTGDDPRGQFSNRSLTSHSFGIEMQI